MLLRDLVAVAGLPAVREVQRLTDGPGLDNVLSLITLVNDQQLLARQPRTAEARQDPAPRAAFLREHSVGAPKTYATSPDGSSLVEWIPGSSLGAHLGTKAAADDPVWHQLGISVAAIHAVTFPTLLHGEVGPTALTLHPTDPVARLRERIDLSQHWIEQSAPRLAQVPNQLRQLLQQHSATITAIQPCLLHGDCNLDNYIVTDRAVRPIDWDYPRVGSPLTELSALDEHAYLHGMADGLPPAFWDGYGQTYPTELLLLYRAVGCLNWLSSPEWDDWQTDAQINEATKNKLRHWHRQLTTWSDGLPHRLQPPSSR